MKIMTGVLAMLMCFLASACVHSGREIPITLLNPEVNKLTVTVNGVTIQDPDGPFLWDWGDETAEKSYFPNMHTYQKPGFYHITVEVSRHGKSNTQDLYLRVAE